MSESMYYVHYRLGFQAGKPNGISWDSGEEKSGMNLYFFDEEQVMDLEDGDIWEEQELENMELEAIDVTTCEKKNRL